MSEDSKDASSDGSGDEGTFTCDVCGEEINNVRYNCSKCEDYDVCELCFIQGTDDDEEERPRHPHRLTAIKLPVKPCIMFSYVSPSGCVVHVGNFACAVPGSSVLKEKKIGAVLSLIELPHPNKEIIPLAQLYSDGPDKVMDGIVYHHLPVADIANPALIGPQGAMALFPETTSFITQSLKAKRNVLVHCELGQRRSPLAFLAWLVTQNVSAQSAISKFASSHKQDGAAWKDKFVSTRSKWIEKLEEWSKIWSVKLKEWQKQNAEDIETWFSSANTATATPIITSTQRTTEPSPSQVVVSSKPADAASKSSVMQKKRNRVIDDDDDESAGEDAKTTTLPASKKLKTSEAPPAERVPTSVTSSPQKVSNPPANAAPKPKSDPKPKGAGGTITSFFKKVS